MSTDRTNSASGALAVRVKNLGQKPKPKIEITLTDEQKDAFCPTYTSLEQIEGEATITAQCDMGFQDVYITFEGASSTYVEKSATSHPAHSRTRGYAPFLRLVQPLDASAFPEPRIIEAGKIYKFPFHFNVPEQMLPQMCDHAKAASLPEGAHLRIPPSLGDPMVAGMGRSLMDDFAPDMSSIAYTLRCRITNGRGASGKHRILVEGSRKLRIIPAVPEEPPLHVEGASRATYKLRKEKNIKRGLFKGRLGRLVMESVQPKSLRQPTVRSESGYNVTTMATTNLRFDPADESSQPPQLGNLSAKLRVVTYYASIPFKDIPSGSVDYQFNNVQGMYVETVSLSSRCVSNSQWEERKSSTPVRRDSVRESQTIHIPEASSAYKGGSFYTASIVVPITLPEDNKVFVPTFHTCFVSRIYIIDLYLSVDSPKKTITDTVLHNRIPVQVSSEGNKNAQPAISAEEANAIASREASLYFEPRTIAPPSAEYIDRAQLIPQDAPPSADAGYTHQRSFGQLPEHSASEYTVRMQAAQQRSLSLSFESERAALAPPPAYASSGGRTMGRSISSAPQFQRQVARVGSI
ncbi:hypothetical protein N7G274_005359 [Stereocaulon virgatum]|uniref:Arrestin-like N-terminal domain-containing protein n=1 Tax=Stereocaulon virgatum TaxID=373712 RepID=A0ABR4ABD8_9LECA